MSTVRRRKFFQISVFVMWNLTYFGSFGLDVDDGNSQVSGDATTQWEWNIRHRTNIAVGNCEGSSSHRRFVLL